MLTFALPGVSTEISMRRGEFSPFWSSLMRVGEMVTLTNAKAPLIPLVYSAVVYEFVYGLIIKGLLVSVSLFVPSLGLYAI